MNNYKIIISLIWLFSSLLFAKSNLLVINQFGPSEQLPSFGDVQESIQIKFGSKLSFFTSHIEQSVLDLFSSDESTVIDKMEIIRELGQIHDSDFILFNTLKENGDISNLNGQLFSVRSGGIIQEKSVRFLKYSDGVFNELLLWAGDIFHKTKSDLVDARDELLFPNPDDIVLDKTPMGAMMRSFAVPGWGQFYSENKTSGLVWSSFEGILISAILYSYSQYTTSVENMNQSLSQYNLSENEREIGILRNDVQTYHTDHIKFNNYIIGFSAAASSTWMSNAIHAYITGPRPEIHIYGPLIQSE